MTFGNNTGEIGFLMKLDKPKNDILGFSLSNDGS